MAETPAELRNRLGAAVGPVSAKVNGVRYHFRDSGPGGQAVLLLHGAPDDGTMWREQVRALQGAGYRVVCPDLLGYGESERPDDKKRYRFGSMAADMAALLHELGIERAHLIAHDFGASVGWGLAAVHPERLLSYAALSVGHVNTLAKLKLANMRWSWNLFLQGMEGAADLCRANDGALFLELAHQHPEVERVWQRMSEPGAIEAMLDWEKVNHVPEILVAGFAGQLPEKFAPAVQVPTLGIWSTEDAYVLENQMAGSADHVEAQWRYERIEGAGHWFMLERPKETNELLLGWLEEQGGP